MKIAKDKIKHCIACAIVSLSVSLTEALLGASFHGTWLAGFLAGTAIGIGKEYGDECAVGNKWDWADIAADTVGSVVGATLGSLFVIMRN